MAANLLALEVMIRTRVGFRIGSEHRILPIMASPSSQRGVFSWAWDRASQYRARFWVGAVVFSAFAAAIGTYVVLPAHATASQKILAAVVGLVGAAVITTVGSYACALAVAPFQQRDALRSELMRLENTITALKTSPVSQAHGNQLRQIAKQLQPCIEPPFEHPNYGADEDSWRPAFAQHFPAVAAALGPINDAAYARERYLSRLDREAELSKITEPPFLYSSFRDELAEAFYDGDAGLYWLSSDQENFNWQSEAGGLWLGYSFSKGIRVIDGTPHDLEQLKAKIDAFLWSINEWPETHEVRIAWDRRFELKNRVKRLLANAANTDPITTRCHLCKGTGTGSMGAVSNQ